MLELRQTTFEVRGVEVGVHSKNAMVYQCELFHRRDAAA
jgi:hypothetical protein